MDSTPKMPWNFGVQVFGNVVELQFLGLPA